MSPGQLTEQLKRRAAELGFDLTGACPAVSPAGLTKFQQWLAAGYAGQMRYLPDREEAYSHPRYVLEGVKSLLMLAMNYRTADPEPAAPGQGRVSRYAWGAADYHDVIHQRLKQLAAFHQELVPGGRARGVVDTAPLLEREFAQLAGLGWIGKNTLLLNKGAGSWLFLAALLTDQELAYDAPTETDHCGSCRACLDACPTDAFPQPYLLDATRCISYLTIELREAIPQSQRSGMGEWLFGCDICQEVCPWNRRAPLSCEPSFHPQDRSNPVDLAELFFLDDDAFRERFRRTPLWRSRRRGILRNAAIVLGNQASAPALPALIRGLADREPLVRGACAWALGRYPQAKARKALVARADIEEDVDVVNEIQMALSETEAA